MSYRAIIAHYYYRHYLPQNAQKRRKLWMNEIVRYIDQHRKIGLQSPVFSYDPTTFLWFLDFNRIGKDPRKAPFSEVRDMAKLLLMVFDLDEQYGKHVYEDVWEKFGKALKLFYEKRKRPQDRPMLIPTLAGSVHDGNQADYFEQTREFDASMLMLK